MGFFDKIFKKNKEETITTNLDLLPSVLENNLTTKRKSLELSSAKTMSEVKYLYEKIKVLLEDIKAKDLENKENERLNKAAFTAKNQMEQQMQKTLDKINPNSCGSELENIYAYSKESYNFLFNEINSYRKSIVYMSIYLKEEMKNLGSNLQELLNKYNELNNVLSSEQNIFFFEKVKKSIVEIKDNKKEINTLEKKIIEFENENKKYAEKISLEENKLNKLKSGEDAKKLEKLNDDKAKLFNEKQALKVELSSIISTVDKPLQRFSSLVDSGRWKIDKTDQELLNNFITNPMLALKKDVNGKQIKSILIEVKKAIEDEKIELKEKEKEKRMDALEELINFDFFGKIFWKVNEIQKEVNEIDNIINKIKITKEIEDQHENIVQLNKKIAENNNLIKVKKSEIELLEQKNENSIEKIKEFGKVVLKKTLIIKY